MLRKKAFIFAVLFLLIWCGTAPLRAESGATAQVRAVLTKAMDIQTRQDLEGAEHRKERAQLVRKLIADNFDSAEMARESLGGYWEKLSASQRSQYQDLFTGLFQDSYTRMVLNFLKKETVEYPDESPQGKGVKVRTVIMRTNEHIPVDYLLDQKNHKWLIRDVIIDEVSVVENYRNTFSRVIRSQSFETLMQKMRIQKKAGEDT
jgi:phospholipid transport system substrate-binding protein